MMNIQYFFLIVIIKILLIKIITIISA